MNEYLYWVREGGAEVQGGGNFFSFILFFYEENYMHMVIDVNTKM